MNKDHSENTSYFHLDAAHKTLYCRNDWTFKTFLTIKAELQTITIPSDLAIINGKDIKNMDSTGVILLRELTKTGQKLEFQEFSQQHFKLLKLVTEQEIKSVSPLPPKKLNFLEKTGHIAVEKITDFFGFLSFIGEAALIELRLLAKPKEFPWKSVFSTTENAGVYALPIIALLSFLIGIVLAYEIGIKLKDYGANIYIVDLLGLAIFREFAPLMTAIIVAGRSGSAFTAQIGTMKIREEVDALRTMGIAPSEILVLPKIMGLFIALPFLTVWSSIFALLGGMMMAQSMLQVTYLEFVRRLDEALVFSDYYTGMIKTPVFALLIASIGCYQGMKVFGSANSVGEKTTKSVVQSIFFIIIFDAVFAVIFSKLKI